MEDNEIHVVLEGETSAACGEERPGGLVSLSEALSEGGRHFTCPRCHQVLTGKQKHSQPPEES